MGNTTPRKINENISESTPRSKPKTPKKETKDLLETFPVVDKNCENFFVLNFKEDILDTVFTYLNTREKRHLMLVCKVLHSVISPHLICFGIQMKQMERLLDGYWEGSGIFVHFHKNRKVKTWTGSKRVGNKRTKIVVEKTSGRWGWIKASPKENHFLIQIQNLMKMALYTVYHNKSRWSNLSPFPSDEAIYEVRISYLDENKFQLEMQATHGSLNSVVMKEASQTKFHSIIHKYYPPPPSSD